MNRIAVIFLGIFFLFITFSCRKNKSLDLNPNVNVANDVILSVSSYTTVFNLLIKARLDTTLARVGHSMIDGAYTIYDSVKREYDFNFSIISPDSVRRSGQITAKLSGDILQKDSYANIIFQDYYEDYGRVGGTDTITNLGVSSGQMVFSDHLSDGFMEKVVGGGTMKLNMKITCTTEASSLMGGNVLFYIRGNISGVSSRGYAFSAASRDSLQDSFSCPWIKGGILDVQVPDAQVTEGYLDFVSSDGCSDVIWYYFDTSSFKVFRNQFSLQN